MASFFFSSEIAHLVCTTFYALCTFTKSTQYLILNASNSSYLEIKNPKRSKKFKKNLKYKTQKTSPFQFFSTMRLFPPASFFAFVRLFSKFLNVSKGSPFNILIFCNWLDVQKIPKGPFLHFSELWDCSNFSFFVFFSSEKIILSPKGPHSSFLIFHNKLDFKKPQSPL